MPEGSKSPGGDRDSAPAGNSRIGTERESSLHRALKVRYAGPEGKTEVAAAGYVCDGMNDSGEFFEIQTGSFGPLKRKARELAELGRLRIIHPIIVGKYIEIIDEGGTVQSRRKSPRRGTEWDLFKALLYAPELPLIPGLTVELILVDIAERRIRDGRGSWRRGGDRITDKILETCHYSVPLITLGDYYRFLPFQAGERFTVRELGDRARIRPDIARKTLYVFTKLKLVERVDKRGNAWVYVSGRGQTP